MAYTQEQQKLLDGITSLKNVGERIRHRLDETPLKLGVQLADGSWKELPEVIESMGKTKPIEQVRSAAGKHYIYLTVMGPSTRLFKVQGDSLVMAGEGELAKVKEDLAQALFRNPAKGAKEPEKLPEAVQKVIDKVEGMTLKQLRENKAKLEAELAGTDYKLREDYVVIKKRAKGK